MNDIIETTDVSSDHPRIGKRLETGAENAQLTTVC